jgi:O-antigen ligase/tetratricopeptide (TPR) repeat protein
MGSSSRRKKAKEAARPVGQERTQGAAGRGVRKTGMVFRLEDAAFAILFLSVALLFSADLESHFVLPKLLALRVSTVLLLLLWVWRLLKSGVAPVRRTIVAVALGLTAWWVLTTFFALFKPLALDGVYDGYRGLWTHLNYIVLFLLAASLVRDRSGLERVLRIFVLTLLPVSIYAMVQYFSGDYIHEAMPVAGPSTIGNRALVAVLLGLALPFTAAFALSAKGIERAGWSALGLLYLANALASAARGALAGIAVSFIVFGILIIRQRGLTRRQMAIAAVMGCCALVIAAGLNYRSLSGLVDRFGSAISWKSDTTGNQRLRYYRAALLAIKEAPVTGVGFDHLRVVYPKYRPPEEARDETARNITPSKVHNMYLQMAMQNGIISLILYVILIGTVLWFLVRALATDREGGAGPVVAAFIASIAGYAVQDLVGWPEVSHQPFFWVLLGLGVAAERIIRAGNGQTFAPQGVRRYAVVSGASFVAALLVVLCVYTAQTMEADRLFYRSGSLDVRRDWPTMETNIQEGLEVWGSHRYHYLDVAGQLSGQRFSFTGDPALYERSVRFLDEALRLNPFDPYILIHRIILDSVALERRRIAQPTGTTAKAAARLLDMDRNNITVYGALTTLKKAEGKFDEALLYAGKAKELQPADFSIYLLDASIREAAGNPGTVEKELRVRARSLASEGPNSEAWRIAQLTLAMFLSETGRFADAIAEAQEVVRQDPENAVAYLIMGGAYASSGRFIDARRSFEKVLSVRPQDGDAMRGLEQVRRMAAGR